MMTTVALSLNEFVDSMLVANLLGSKAMAVVNLGFPVMLLMATIYTLFGTGGATLYAVALGERNPEKAGKALCLSLMAAGSFGCVITAAGLLMPNIIIPYLCQDSVLSGDFSRYFNVLVLSAPILSLVLTLVAFLPPSGSPKLSTAVNVVANVVNLVMDYVYIVYFNMGVEGAAWATLTGYVVGALMIPIVLLQGKVKIRFARAGYADLPILRECANTGGAAAMSQFGFAIKFAACNSLAALYGGTAGVVAFSFCLQALSVVSVFYAGIIGAAMPLLAVLHGQRDYYGGRYVLKKALKYSIAIVLLFVAWFEIAPEHAANIYDIVRPDEHALAIYGLRIFAICFLIRGICLVFMYYLQILGEKIYAMAISLFDGFAGLVPLAWLLCHFMGLDGLWWAYPINSIMLLCGILLWNKHLAGGRYTGLLLTEQEEVAIQKQDFTMTGEKETISRISLQVTEICKKWGMKSRTAKLVGSMIEEMAVYSERHHRIIEEYDVLLRLYDDRVEIDFRSLGDSCNPLQDSDIDDDCNLAYLRKLSASLEYDYIMGMNSTHIVLRKG